MRVLIGIESCHQQRVMHQQIRETWLNGPQVDVRFFLGRPFDKSANDEVCLDAPDDYDSLWMKTLAMIQWAYDYGYDFLFKCDNDTYVCIPRLLASGFEKHDYSGRRNTTWEPAYGGSGYWLSRLSMRTVLENRYSELHRRCEDWWVFSILNPAGIVPFHDARYNVGAVGPQSDNGIITCHKRDKYPETDLRRCARMYDMHRRAGGVK